MVIKGQNVQTIQWLLILVSWSSIDLHSPVRPCDIKLGVQAYFRFHSSLNVFIAMKVTTYEHLHFWLQILDLHLLTGKLLKYYKFYLTSEVFLR